jgi:hypothetical protein
MKYIIINLFLLFGLLTFTPAWANNDGRDDTQVYQLYPGMDINSIVKYRSGSNPRFSAKLVYPQLESDEDVQDFNTAVQDLMDDEIDKFKEQIIQNQSTKTKNTLYIDFNTSAITSGDDRILSLRFSIQSYISGMAHPTHYHQVLNYDLYTGEEIELADLFFPDADYLSTIATYCREALYRRLPDKQMIDAGTMPTMENYKIWNIKPNGLVITFEEAQVAPYVQGAQTVLVPYSALRLILSPGSPIAYCVVHRSKCTRSNVLTGGFIDEAANTHGSKSQQLT